MKVSILHVFFFFIICNLSSLTIKDTVLVAGDIGEWPPYTYYERSNHKKNNHLKGYTVELLDSIFTKNNLNYKIDLLPWKRSLLYVKDGEKYLIAIDASYSKQRDLDYYISEPIYETHATCFFNKERFPNGINIQNKEDLKDYQIGGLLGYNYSHYGLSDYNLDKSARNFDQLLLKLKFNRIEIFLENYEIIYGFSKIGKNFLEKYNLGYKILTDVEPVKFYLLISRNEKGKELKELINKEIITMRKNGTIGKILKKYIEY